MTTQAEHEAAAEKLAAVIAHRLGATKPDEAHIAGLIAAALADAVRQEREAEREACAEIAEQEEEGNRRPLQAGEVRPTISSRIRARGSPSHE